MKGKNMNWLLTYEGGNSGKVQGYRSGAAGNFTNQLKPILSNERMFFINLYQAGVGEKIENMFREMLAGPGAVKKTVHKYMGAMQD